MSEKWDLRFMEMADLVAKWSKDPSTQVGCVLVDQNRHIIATGYNGFPRGVRDSEERLNDRPTKYLMVLHGEANAVLQAVAPIAGATAYVSHRPCANCSGMLIQAGVKRIVTRLPADGFAERFADSFRAADMMLGEAGVEIVYLAVATDDLSSPKFDEADRVHDWRNYVGAETRALWHTLSFTQRKAIYTDAEVIAAREDWD